MMSLGTWNRRSSKYQKFLNLSNVFMLIVSTILLFFAGMLIRFYHLTKLDFWSWYFYACPMCMLALGLYTFAVSVYGFLISNQESRGLISLVAIFFSIAFFVQIFSVFTAFELRNIINLEYVPHNAVLQNMKEYAINEDIANNWDVMQRDLRCCGGMQYETAFNDWTDLLEGQNDVPDSCCHKESPGCGREKILRQETSYRTDIGIWKDGCLEILRVKLKEEVVTMMIVYAVVGVLLALVELITVVLACSYIAQISRRIRRNKLFSRAASAANDEDYMPVPSLTSKETNF